MINRGAKIFGDILGNYLYSSQQQGVAKRFVLTYKTIPTFHSCFFVPIFYPDNAFLKEFFKNSW